jgi:hypothetical protein
MEIRQYIESGILETYLMGFATEQEQREVECLSMIYPEIKEELDILEDTLLLSATQNIVAPPSDLKSKVMAAIDNVQQNTQSTESSNVVKLNIQNSQESISKVENNDTKIVKMIPQNRIFAIAAMFLLLVGAITIYVFNQNNKAMEQLVAKHQVELD